jgi:hypothetical protein
MEQKRRITVFNVAIAQLTSTMMLPIIWILVGSILQWLLVGTTNLSDGIASLFYYLILIGSYYGGLRYSFWYVSKNLVVTQPKKSAKIASFLFFFGLLSTYFVFYSYHGEHNYFRLITFFILAFMYLTLTNKYFSSLKPDDNMKEYSLTLQVVFTIVNLSLVIMLAILTIWLVKDYPWTMGLYYAVLACWMGDCGSKINNFLFVPYFHKDHEPIPIKKVFFILGLTIPINAFLIYMISKGALS